jgi:hypothetical protein
MTLNLISLATVKTQLGITASTNDSALTALIPIVSADIRRILNNQFNRWYSCAFSSASKNIDLSIYTTRYREEFSGIGESEINIGTVVTDTYLPADTYIDSFDPISGLFTLSATPTGSGTTIYPTINICQWPTIAKMIWYKFSQQNTTSASKRLVSSVSAGPVTTSYAQSEINQKYNYPQTLINDLGIPYARIS